MYECLFAFGILPFLIKNSTEQFGMKK